MAHNYNDYDSPREYKDPWDDDYSSRFKEVERIKRKKTEILDEITSVWVHQKKTKYYLPQFINDDFRKAVNELIKDGLVELQLLPHVPLPREENTISINGQATSLNMPIVEQFEFGLKPTELGITDRMAAKL